MVTKVEIYARWQATNRQAAEFALLLEDPQLSRSQLTELDAWFEERPEHRHAFWWFCGLMNPEIFLDAEASEVDVQMFLTPRGH